MNIKKHIKQNGILLLIGLLVLISLIILGVRNSDLKGQALPLTNKLYIQDQTVAPGESFNTEIWVETDGSKEICGIKFRIFFPNNINIDQDNITFDSSFPWTIQFVDYEQGIGQNPNILSYETYRFFEEPLLTNNQIGTIQVLEPGATNNFTFKLDQTDEDLNGVLDNMEITACSGEDYGLGVGKFRKDVQNNKDDDNNFILDDNFTIDDGDIAVLDTTPPEIDSTVPPDDDEDNTLISINTPFTITFDESVTPANGNIELWKAGDLTPILSILATQIPQVNPTTFSTPPGSLATNTDYYILIDAGAFEDTSGNPFSGISDPDKWNFKTETD